MDKVIHDSETPARGLQVITACAFIHQNFDGIEKVLLPKRADTKKFMPGIFELPGGHIDFAEDIIDGLKREVMEEMGVRVSIGDPFSVFTYTNEIKGSHSIEVVYFGKLQDSAENIKINSEDHSEYRWVSEDEFADLATMMSKEEFANVKKGFQLLRGEPLQLG